MKKLFTTVCILITLGFMASDAIAQRAGGIGVRGGLNIANLNDTDADVESRTGFMAGVYTSFAVANSPVSIQPEVLYTQKGFESGDVTYKLNYVEVPVLARFDFITDSGLLPHVYFGPYIGFNVSAESDGDGLELPGESDDLKDSVKDTDIGVVVGGGVDFGRVDLGVRYNAGLTNTFEEGDGKNGIFSIVAGIGF